MVPEWWRLIARVQFQTDIHKRPVHPNVCLDTMYVSDNSKSAKWHLSNLLDWTKEKPGLKGSIPVKPLSWTKGHTAAGLETQTIDCIIEHYHMSDTREILQLRTVPSKLHSVY